MIYKVSNNTEKKAAAAALRCPQSYIKDIELL